MRDTPRDVGPGRRALREDEFGNIIDGDDVAVFGFRSLFAGHAHGKIPLLAVAVDGDLALHETLMTAARGVKDFRKFGGDFAERQTKSLAFGTSDQSLRRAIENGDEPFGIDADDACACTGQHRLRKTPAAVDLIARPHDVFMLGA